MLIRRVASTHTHAHTDRSKLACSMRLHTTLLLMRAPLVRAGGRAGGLGWLCLCRTCSFQATSVCCNSHRYADDNLRCPVPSLKCYRTLRRGRLRLLQMLGSKGTPRTWKLYPSTEAGLGIGESEQPASHCIPSQATTIPAATREIGTEHLEARCNKSAQGTRLRSPRPSSAKFLRSRFLILPATWFRIVKWLSGMLSGA